MIDSGDSGSGSDSDSESNEGNGHDNDDSDSDSDESESASSNVWSKQSTHWIVAIVIVIVGVMIGILLCKRFSKRKVRTKQQFVELKEEIDKDDQEKEMEMNENVATAAIASDNQDIHDQILQHNNPDSQNDKGNNEGVIVTAAVV